MLSESDRRAAMERLRPSIDRAGSFSGWDFPDMRHPVLLDPGPPWDYEALVREYGAAADRALDLGTGGGEFIVNVRGDLPPEMVATEEWHVNAPIAYQRLRPLGVDTVWCRSLQLPFRDEMFGLVVDRHEELEPSEVARVLRPGGTVITQQIGAENWCELQRYFGAATAGNRGDSRIVDFGDIRSVYTRGFSDAGLTVLRSEKHDYKVAYENLSDFLFMLLITPWTIPDLDVERDLELLLQLEQDCLTDDGLAITWSRDLIIAVKHD